MTVSTGDEMVLLSLKRFERRGSRTARTTLMLREIAERLGVSERHIQREVEAGALRAINMKGARSTRAYLRVAIEDFLEYVLVRFTGPFCHQALCQLPPDSRRELLRELQDSLNK